MALSVIDLRSMSPEEIARLLELAKKPWEMFLVSETQEQEIELLRKHERTGRPLGGDSFIEKLEFLLDRNLKPKKSGPKKKDR
jgi:putative transposase